MSNIIVDTSKIKKDIVKEFEEIEDNFNIINKNINAILDLNYLEISSKLEFIKKNIDNHGKMCNEYIKKMNSIVEEFDNLSDEMVKSANQYEKINISNIMSKK